MKAALEYISQSGAGSVVAEICSAPVPNEISMHVDGVRYYVYDKTNGPLEWPFDQPQNLVLNLAMGGGMGGAIDPEIQSQQFVIDYVRVFSRK